MSEPTLYQISEGLQAQARKYDDLAAAAVSDGLAAHAALWTELATRLSTAGKLVRQSHHIVTKVAGKEQE